MYQFHIKWRDMISIIVPNYNGSNTISMCLRNIYSSTYKNYEVIVVDDGSTDNSISEIKKYNCKLVKLNKNKGPSCARNAGAEFASGDIFLFIDSDVCIQNDTLNLINGRFNMDADISAVVGMPDKYCKFKNIASQHFNLRVHFNYLNMPKYIPILYGSLCAVKKEAFFNVGGFDTELKKAGVEDNDLGYRLNDNNYKILLDKNIQFNHYKYISLLKLLKNDFLRASDRRKLMLRRNNTLRDIYKHKRFISTPINHIYSAIIAPLIILFLFSSFFFIYNILFTTLFVLLFFIYNRDYFFFVGKEKSYLFAIMIYFLLIIDMLIVDFGIISGSITYAGGSKH